MQRSLPICRKVSQLDFRSSFRRPTLTLVFLRRGRRNGLAHLMEGGADGGIYAEYIV